MRFTSGFQPDALSMKFSTRKILLPTEIMPGGKIFVVPKFWNPAGSCAGNFGTTEDFASMASIG